MMRAYFTTIAALLAALATISSSTVTFAATAPPAAIPAFCIKTGGPKSPGEDPLICRFFTYQECLDAVAELHGSCVANLDRKGAVFVAPAASASRRSK